uniref:PAP-associated domain-containing protein n=1 Tax=Ascaris lumbricoides TaxID=6252 RepID=A0A9J2Q5C2_ASCLU
MSSKQYYTLHVLQQHVLVVYGFINGAASGKRKAVDVAEQEVIAAKRNRMITVLPEEMVEKTDTAGSAVATERIEDGAENSINSDKEGFDFVKLFEEDPPAENEPISPTSGNTSTQKSTDSGNKSVLSQQSVGMAPSNNNKLENIIEFVKLFDDDDTPVEGNEVSSNKRVPYTPNDDCECIFVTEVRKTSKGIPVVTIDDDNERREVVKGSPSTLKPECDYGPDTIDTQTPSTSYLPPLRSGDRSVTNNNNGHVAGEIDMEIEEDREEITVLSDDIGQRKSANTPHPYNGPSNMISLQRLKEMDLRTKLGVTIVASALDVYDTIKARRKRYQQGFDAFDAHIWRHYRLNGQDDRTFSWKMEVRERLLSLVKTVRVYEDANIVAVGSTVNGCGAYNSDMDLCLCLPDAIYGYDTDRDYGVRVLKKVFRVLAYQSNGLVRKCHCIPAKVSYQRVYFRSVRFCVVIECKLGFKCNRSLSHYNFFSYGVRVLKKVFRVLAYQSNGLVRKCHCIPAKVPILKLEMGNEYSELEIDINCNNVAGIYNSHLLHYYARIDDRFPALCLLVKHWAINAGINDAMSGTFNSYSLILLVLHFLQCATMPPVLPNLQVLHPDIFNGHCGLDNLELFRNLPPLPTRELNRNTVGELLIAFFDYYAKFDFVNKAISIHRGCVFDRSDLATSTRRFKVFIEEPFDHENTARCVTRVDSAKYIKQVFIAARNAFLGASAGVPLLKLIDVH